MSVRTLFLTEAIYEYMIAVSSREPDALRELRQASGELEGHHRQASPEQAQLMALLCELIGARRALEVGTFRGYSALALALALGPGGTVVTCDIDAELVSWAHRYWEKAGVADRIDARVGPALPTLDALLAQGKEGTFDFAFLDADKVNHDAYYERALRLVRRGGLIVLDNVFWEGLVLDETVQDPDTAGIRALNLKLRDDPRVSISTIPLSDGLTLARKR